MARHFEVVTLRLDPRSRRGRRTLDRYAADGWRVVSTVTPPLLAFWPGRVIYTLHREVTT